MPASLRPPPEPRGDLILLADTTAEGEEVASLLRMRGFAVQEIALADLATRLAASKPRVVLLDVDAPGAIDRASQLELGREGAPELLCLGDPLRASELGDVPQSHVFERPLDVTRLIDRVAGLATPSEEARGPRATTPPPEQARPSSMPGHDSVPPISEIPRQEDPVELGAFLDGDEEAVAAGILATGVRLSPDLLELIRKAEARVVVELEQHASLPAPAEQPDVIVPPDMLIPLDEPLDAPDESAGTGAEGTGSIGTGALASAGTGSMVLGMQVYTPAPRPITNAGLPADGTEAPSAPPMRGLAPLSSDPFGPSPQALTSAGVSIDSAAPPSAAAPSVPPPAAPQQTPTSRPGAGAALGARLHDLAARVEERRPEERRPDTNRELGGGLVGLPAIPPPGSLSGGPTLQGSLLAAQLAGSGLLGHRPATATSTSAELVLPAVEPRVGELPQPSLPSPLSPPVRFQEPRAMVEGRPTFDLRSLPPPEPAPSAAAQTGLGATALGLSALAVRASPAAQSVPGPQPRETSRSIPMVFGEAEGLRPLGRAIAVRLSGCLTFNTSEGIRRIVLHDGDVVTAASEVASESLVAFLAGRGDLDRDAAARLAGKLPPSGRHAGAALIAQGFLVQDDLWPVLRAHAEWLIGKVMQCGPGTIEVDDEPPGRLKAEPSAFGGAAGAEVYVETARRVLPPQRSYALLGGRDTRFDRGGRENLLAECALGRDEEAVMRAAPGRSLGEIVPDPDSELGSVLRALVELEVLATLAAVRPVPDRKRDEPDPIDEEAVRQRVKARAALVREGDYFSLLGVARTATAYEIKRAYLELRRGFEPTRLLTAQSADLLDDVRLIVEVLDEAYEILRDGHRRERYRRAIEAGPPE